MQRHKRGVAFLIGLCFSFAIAVVSSGDPPREHDSDAKTDQKGYTRPSDPSLYVGSETCKTCHADMPTKGFFQGFEDSPHFVTTLDTKKGPAWQGCESCHGPGKAHVDGGGDKTKIFTFKGASAKEISGIRFERNAASAAREPGLRHAI